MSREFLRVLLEKRRKLTRLVVESKTWRSVSECGCQAPQGTEWGADVFVPQTIDTQRLPFVGSGIIRIRPCQI
jgi:hypothetical protein